MVYFSCTFVPFLLCCLLVGVRAETTAQLLVDASPVRKIPKTLFGIFFEEINHAGEGGIWAELVSNRGFEAGGSSTPSNIEPWSAIGTENLISISTERSSCFSRNQVALRMDVFCNTEGPNICPSEGVGVYNPGYWGMNIEQGKTYKVVLHVRSWEEMNLTVSFTSSDGLQHLADANIVSSASEVSYWKKVNLVLKSKGTNHNARLQLTTRKRGTIWIDQVSAMPADTYKGHGFRTELVTMLKDLKPAFIRFPGGCYVEGDILRNAFRWRDTIGPWEERPGHLGDVWNYWTDDGLGYFELLQLAEDIGATPIWVFNNGVSHREQVDPSLILPFVKNILNGIEFARGDASSTWGSIRASMGHPEPFELKYLAIGNEDCSKPHYKDNYLRFYTAIGKAYPDIKLITNCDGSNKQLDHPADLYDFHIYTSANDMYSKRHLFDHALRNDPKAFVSEYAVTGHDAGTGSLLAALAEAAFLMGLEKNSDIVEMASYAPLFVNDNNRGWNPDSIVFNSWQQYGTPSYWMQHFFKESNGAFLHSTIIQGDVSNSLFASAVTWKSDDGNHSYLRIKVVNYNDVSADLNISVEGLTTSLVDSFNSVKTVLTSKDKMDENSFKQPSKIVPVRSLLPNAGRFMEVVIPPYSLSAFDLALVAAIDTA